MENSPRSKRPNQLDQMVPCQASAAPVPARLRTSSTRTRAITVRGRPRRRLLLNVTKVLQAMNEGLSTDAVLARKILQKPVIQKIKIVVTRQIGLDKFFRRQQ
jgi:hypothetical protein